MKKNGISLILLIITIIVVVILATAVILSISNNNPIEKAKEARDMHNDATLKEAANLAYLDWYSESVMGNATETAEVYVKRVLGEQGFSGTEISKLEITDSGVTTAKYTLRSRAFNTQGQEEGSSFLDLKMRAEVTKVIFEDTTKNAPEDAIDLSVEENNGILGWMDGTEAHIASDGEIYVNEDAGSLFAYLCSCTEIQNFKLLNTSKVTNMKAMFRKTQKLTNIDLSNFDTSNVTDMAYMFNECNNLINLDVSTFDTSNVTDMEEMFRECSNLEKIYVSDKFVTNKAKSSSNMFYNCTALVGGNGTTYNSSYTDATYARIDKQGQEGYFSTKP